MIQTHAETPTYDYPTVASRRAYVPRNDSGISGELSGLVEMSRETVGGPIHPQPGQDTLGIFRHGIVEALQLLPRLTE